MYIYIAVIYMIYWIAPAPCIWSLGSGGTGPEALEPANQARKSRVSLLGARTHINGTPLGSCNFHEMLKKMAKCMALSLFYMDFPSFRSHS